MPPSTFDPDLETPGLLHDSDEPPSPALRVLLSHQRALVREGTRRILEGDAGFDVVAETSTLVSAVPLIDTLKPDVVVLALEPEEIESRTFVKQLRDTMAIVRVLVLNEGIAAHRLARLGVTSWIATTASPVEVIAAIRAAAEGRDVSGRPTTIGPDDAGLSGHPTPRELEVLALIERGLTTRAIAERLQTTPRTIHFHVGNLFTKLGARSRTEMVHLARRRGWLE